MRRVSESGEVRGLTKAKEVLLSHITTKANLNPLDTSLSMQGISSLKLAVVSPKFIAITQFLSQQKGYYGRPFAFC